RTTPKVRRKCAIAHSRRFCPRDKGRRDAKGNAPCPTSRLRFRALNARAQFGCRLGLQPDRTDWKYIVRHCVMGLLVRLAHELTYRISTRILCAMETIDM